MKHLPFDIKSCGSVESLRLIGTPIQESDTALLVFWRNLPQNHHYFRAVKVLTEADHLRWLQNNYSLTPDRCDYLVRIRETQKPIGTLTISRRELGVYEFGYMIGEISQRGKGYAREIVSAAEQHAMLHLCATRFLLEIHRENIPSIRLAEALGYLPAKSEGDFWVFQKEVTSHT